MEIRPVSDAPIPAYPDARTVMADPRVFVRTYKPRKWTKFVWPGTLITGGLVVGGTLLTLATTATTMGAICPTPQFTEAEAIAIIEDEMAKGGHPLMPAFPLAMPTVGGIEVDRRSLDGETAIEYFHFDYYRGADPQLEDALINGDPYIRVQLPDGSDGPAVGIFHGYSEEEIRQQVRDFIEWLESQQ